MTHEQNAIEINTQEPKLRTLNGKKISKTTMIVGNFNMHLSETD